jgi:uncharacterized protein
VGILREDVQRFVREQRLGFVATVNPDGSPNVSPKGTVTIRDGDHLVFADIRSPGTVANLKRDPRVEINVVDMILRKGFRFRGRGRFSRRVQRSRNWWPGTRLGASRPGRRPAAGSEPSYSWRWPRCARSCRRATTAA